MPRISVRAVLFVCCKRYLGPTCGTQFGSRQRCCLVLKRGGNCTGDNLLVCRQAAQSGLFGVNFLHLWSWRVLVVSHEGGGRIVGVQIGVDSGVLGRLAAALFATKCGAKSRWEYGRRVGIDRRFCSRRADKTVFVLCKEAFRRQAVAIDIGRTTL